MGYISFSLNHLQFLLFMFYGSQCISLSHPWSGFFLSILFFCGVILNSIVFFHSFSDASLLVKRNATNFSMLILYPATLLNSFISSSGFYMESLGFSIYSIMSSAYNTFLPQRGSIYKIYIIDTKQLTDLLH